MTNLPEKYIVCTENTSAGEAIVGKAKMREKADEFAKGRPNTDIYIFKLVGICRTETSAVKWKVEPEQ